jgi:hypothetical protein
VRAQRRRKLLWPLVAILLVAQPLVAFATPDNDARGDATPVAAIPFSDLVDVTDATVEADEPEPTCAPTGMTVWYALTLPKKTPVVVDTSGSGYDTVVAVYTADLQEVACNDDAGGLQSLVGFSAARGQTYLIQVGSFDGTIDPEWATPELAINIHRGHVRDVRPRPQHYRFGGLMASSWQDVDHEDGWGYRGVELYRNLTGRRFEEVWLFSSQVHVEEKGAFTVVNWHGWAPLTNGSIDRQLRSAFVDQPVEVYGHSCTLDGLDEEPDPDACRELGSEVVDVVLDWTGVGEISRITDRYRERTEDGTWTSRSRVRYREADVVGGIAGEQLSFELTDAPSGLSEVRSMEMWRPAR